MLDGEKLIIERAVKRDEGAFGALYSGYQPQIYRFIFLKVRDRFEAEDMTHQVFLNAWRTINSYRDMGHPFSSWLYRIARNEVIDYYRTKKDVISLENMDPEISPVSADFSASAERGLDWEKVSAAVGSLKPVYQDVVIMRFVEDMSVAEVAAVVEKSEGAVKLIQHRAIEELKKNLSV